MENWFKEQSSLTQLILLIIPWIGWLVEIFVRISVVIRKHSRKNIIGLVLAVLLGGSWIFCIIDLVYLLHKEDLMLVE